MPTTHAQYHGAQLNLWINDCPVIASHGLGNTIEIIDNYREIVHSNGSVDRISTGIREYCLKFTLYSSVLTLDQHWFIFFNNTASIGEEVPISLKFSLVGSPIDPVLIAGRLKLVAIHNVAESFDFEFTGAPPIPYSPTLSNVQSVSPTPSLTHTVLPSATASIEIPFSENTDLIEESPSEEPTDSLSLSVSGSIPWSPSESYSYSPSNDTPEEEDYGPSLEERAEQMQFELKKLMEQMEKKGIQPKRKVSFN